MKYRLPEEFVNEVREANDLVEVASEYMTLTKSGDRHLGLCPFHREDTPSFNISADKQLYHCFGCGAGGNVITFIMNIENLSFLDAIKMLADRCGLFLPQAGIQKGVSERYKTVGDVIKTNVAAAKYYAQALRTNKRAMQYLTDRGLSDQTIKRFGLGYAPADRDGLTGHLKRAGFEMSIMQKAGLISTGKDGGTYERFRDRIMFPIIDVRGRVTGFGGRMLGEGKGAKYLNSSETPVFHKGSTLYGLNRAKNNIIDGELIVVEGYMDVISLYEHGIKNTVASLGTAFTQQQGELIKRYSQSIIIAYDSDAAGQTAARRGMDILEGMGCRVRIMQMPEGKDPDDFIRLYGKDMFRHALSQALPLIDYKIDLLEKKHDLTDKGGRIEFLKEAAGLLAKLESELERAHYIKKVAQKAKVYETILREEVIRLAKRGSKHKRNIHGKNRHNNSSGYIYTVKEANIEAERTLIIMMVKDQSLRQRLMKSLKKEDFADRLHRELFEKLSEDGGTKSIMDADLINTFDEPRDINTIVAIVQEELPVPEEGTDKIINDCIHTITVHKIKQRSEFLKEEIERLAQKGIKRTGDEENQYKGYCEEFMDIQRKLRNR